MPISKLALSIHKNVKSSCVSCFSGVENSSQYIAACSVYLYLNALLLKFSTSTVVFKSTMPPLFLSMSALPLKGLPCIVPIAGTSVLLSLSNSIACGFFSIASTSLSFSLCSLAVNTSPYSKVASLNFLVLRLCTSINLILSYFSGSSIAV